MRVGGGCSRALEVVSFALLMLTRCAALSWKCRVSTCRINCSTRDTSMLCRRHVDDILPTCVPDRILVWWFLFSALGGIDVSGGTICTLFSDCFGGCGVKLYRSGVTVMEGIFTLENFGATLGGGPGGCVDDSVGT